MTDTLPSIYSLFDKRRTGLSAAPATGAAAVPPTGIHPYAEAIRQAWLGRLRSLAAKPWQKGDAWDHNSFVTARKLTELANSPWSGYGLSEAQQDFMAHAPHDHAWDERLKCWEQGRDYAGADALPEPEPGDLPPTTVLDVAPDADASPASTLASRMVDGGTFILDTPSDVPAIWGNGNEVLWAEGESCIVAGPPGVGKTTITGQLVRGLIGLDSHVLGYAMQPATGRVLYLAMDRPQQIARALARCFTEADRALLRERVPFWKGPPPADIAKNPHLLAALAEEAGASVIIIDSLKDAALGLSEDEVGAAYNRARQTALAAGVEVLELHHVVKRGPNGARPNTLADLYGSAWITAGAGSVVLLWGAAGDPIVDLAHLKQPAEPVGPLRVMHDHAAGTSTVWHSTDPLAVVQQAGASGVTAQQLACAIFETDKPDRNEIEKARRRLDKLVRDGLAETHDAPDPRGGPARTVYRALTHALTHLPERESLTDHARTHETGITAGQPLTGARTPLTPPSTHVPTPPFKGGGTGALNCGICNEPMSFDDGTGTHPTCTPERDQ